METEGRAGEGNTVSLGSLSEGEELALGFQWTDIAVGRKLERCPSGKERASGSSKKKKINRGGEEG